MKYEEYDNNYDISSGNDIYSNSKKEEFEDISSVSSEYRKYLTENQPPKKEEPKPAKKRRKRKTHKVRNTIIVLLCVVISAVAGFYGYAYKTLNKMAVTPLEENDLGIETAEYGEVRNIALLGIDSRQDNDIGRSDAIVVLTVDKKHKKLKLTSIARDTYVSIDGHSKDKLTHAYAYGKSQLAVKTLNQNFDLEITDYVTMNFFELANVIDYIGGVTVDVDEKERIELNKNIFPEMRGGLGRDCPDLTVSGLQTLNGPQAVCYARIRHIDSDIERGNRQKEVLMAMFTKVKSMNPLKLPTVAEMILEECTTSLNANDIISLGTWAIINSPEFEQLSIPNDNIPSSGKRINGAWCFVYDLELAKREIHDFIFEENFYSPEAVAEREENEDDNKK